jgi:hypothetical protein
VDAPELFGGIHERLVAIPQSFVHNYEPFILSCEEPSGEKRD